MIPFPIFRGGRRTDDHDLEDAKTERGTETEETRHSRLRRESEQIMTIRKRVVC